MTEADRKARLAELELAASNPYADNHVLLQYADALDEECRLLQMQREVQQPKQQAPVRREVQMSSNTPSQAEIDERFNTWFQRSFDAHFKASIEPYMTFLAEEIGEHTGKLHREVDLLSRDIKNIVDANGGVRNSATGKLKLQKLDDVVAKLRTDMRTELAKKLKSQADAARGSNITNLPAVISRKS